MIQLTPPKAFDKLVSLQYELYNGLFLTLPFSSLKTVGIKLPVFAERCHDLLGHGHTPSSIVEEFFIDVVHTVSFKEQMDVLFLFSQLIERQIVLFDALEASAFTYTHTLDGEGSLSSLVRDCTDRESLRSVARAMQHYHARIVLTAHPTQFYPEAILGIIDELSEVLKKRDLLAIEQILLQLGKTSFRNPSPPTPLSEAVNLLDRTNKIFYKVIIDLEQRVDALLESDRPNPPLIELGYWPGGDRDGNPYVDVETTLNTAAALRECTIDHYREELANLRKRLTFPEMTEELNRVEEGLEHYSHPDHLLEDLDRLRELVATKHGGLFIEHVDRFRVAVRTFGFHYASLDLRQDSSVHETCVGNLLSEIAQQDDGPPECGSYALLSPGGKRRLLEELCDRDLTRFSHLSVDAPPEFEDVMGSLKAVRTIQKRNGPQGLHRYIISNTGGAHHILEVYLLARISGYKELPFDIVPLFETIEDLQRAETIMDELYRSALYQRHLRKRNAIQVIMVGFSDGTKDGGYVTCNWEILQAKKRLARQAAQHSLEVVFFDGRGGPPARGGGNTHRFYEAVGFCLDQRQIQLTIQGQTISSKFGTEAAARFNIEQLFTAGLGPLLTERNSHENTPGQDQLLTHLSDVSGAAYRQLREHPCFLPFLEEATPLTYFGQLNVASRPMKRRQEEKLNLKDLRAIPFVGAWSQIKLNIPGYYGLGTALKQGFDAGNGLKLQMLYQRNLFFRTLVDNAMQALAKSNEAVTAHLLDHKVYGSFVQTLHTETQRTRTYLLKVTSQSYLLQDDPINSRSIALRERLILPLLVIQQHAMTQLRNGVDDEQKTAYEKLLKKTLPTITNASRNSA